MGAGGCWVGAGFTRLMLLSTQVEVAVELKLELSLAIIVEIHIFREQTWQIFKIKFSLAQSLQNS